MQVANPLKPQRKRIVLLIVVSVVSFACGAYRLWDILSFSIPVTETRGQIVARDGFKFTIQYNVESKTYRITEDLPSTKGMSGLQRMKLQPGSMVGVLYDPSSPANAKWAAKRNWFFPLALIFVSVLAGVTGFFPDIAARQLRPKDR